MTLSLLRLLGLLCVSIGLDDGEHYPYNYTQRVKCGDPVV